jgi:hypothetical protein
MGAPLKSISNSLSSGIKTTINSPLGTKVQFKNQVKLITIINNNRIDAIVAPEDSESFNKSV